ncbi:hypothetical protein RJ639_033926 [Escallonia herrerae]|uniref:Protein kinase domain-containing protein n=1 Tax=Escallonia herrerae TaxID=1293975 RepID=A0AA88WTG2_9ASTE|nr:hypothetical protein RJ639_033926 [Escallonia herrerae]
MAKGFSHTAVTVLVILTSLIWHSEQLQSSQAQTLLRIQALLNFPPALTGWNNQTDFCNSETNSTVTVVCYDDSITQLHIIGKKGFPPLPRNFSIDSFVTTLARLPSLKVLTLVSHGLWGPLPGKIARLSNLEILNLTSNFFDGAIPQEVSYLSNLQTLVLDGNLFSGQLPDALGSLSLLVVLSLKKNSLDGPLPDQLGSLENLRVLSLSDNQFTGAVPDLSSLTNLQVLDLENNSLGPQFPQVGTKIVTLILKKNKFRYGIPDKVNSYFQLERLDVSFNKFVEPFKPSIMSLPSITYLSIEQNRFTGLLSEDLPCNGQLEFVDLSANLLTGRLPNCLISDPKKRVLRYSGNCLTDEDNRQHPYSFCRTGALAVGIIPHRRKPKHASKVVTALSITGGIIAGTVLVVLTFLVTKRVCEKMVKVPSTRLIAENASTGYTSKLYSDASKALFLMPDLVIDRLLLVYHVVYVETLVQRLQNLIHWHITRAMKLGALDIPSYRTFSLEELEAATNSFATSSFIGEGSSGQVYRGQLKDGSLVAIRCLKMRKSHSTQSFMQYIELISKLRHQHLVSALGYCFECYLDDSSVSTIMLVFQYFPTGTLRDWITERHGRQALTWSQRIAAAIGIAKGIKFLHTGIVPGVFSNHLKATDILLDQNLVAKICSYSLPLLAENMEKVRRELSFPLFRMSAETQNLFFLREKPQEKLDVYDFGVILIEIIVGRPLSTQAQVQFLRDQVRWFCEASLYILRISNFNLGAMKFNEVPKVRFLRSLIYGDIWNSNIPS